MADDAPDTNVNWDDLQPVEHSAAPAQEAPNWDDLQPVQQQPQGPAPEGPIKSFLREAAHGIIPTVAGAVTGVGGAALGTAVAPGAGTFAGGIGGAALGAAAADKAQDTLLKAMGWDDSAQRQANAAENPTASTAGAFAPAVAAFSPGGLSTKLATRLATGAITGGLNLGQQAAEGNGVSPGEVAGAALTGALLPNARPWLGAAEAAGTRLGERLKGAGTPSQEGAIPTPEESATPSATEPVSSVPESVPETASPDPATQTSGALSGRPPAPGEGGAVNPVKAVATPEEAAATTNTPMTTGAAAGTAQSHDPDVQSRTIPANVQSGDGFVAVQTPRDQSTGFNEKKTKTPRAGVVETMPSTPIDNSQLGADVEQTIQGVWGARPESFTEGNIKKMAGLPTTPAPPEGMVFPPKNGQQVLPPGQEPPNPRQIAAEQAGRLNEQDLLDTSRAQREAMEGIKQRQAADQVGEAWENLQPGAPEDVPQDVRSWMQQREVVPTEETPSTGPKTWMQEHEVLTPQTPEEIEHENAQGGSFAIPADNSIPDFLKRSPPPARQAMLRGNMPQNLAAATDRIRKALGITSTPAADEAINASTPAGQAPRTTQNAIESFLRKNGVVKAFNDLFSVRGSLTPEGEAAAANIMKNAALRDRNVQKVSDQLDDFHPVVNAMPRDQQVKFQESMENGNKFAFMPSKGLNDLISSISKIHKAGMDYLHQNNILDAKDYFSKFWPDQFTNPGMAKKFLDEWDSDTPPSLSDGMKAGLDLKNANPITATLAHAKAVERFAELQRIVNEGIEQGYVREAEDREPTDVKLEASGLQNRPLYAPEGWARNFNNHFSKSGDVTSSNLYQTYRKASNLLTQIQLAGPVFHGITMIGEGSIAKVAQGIQNAAAGNFKTALKRITESPAAGFTYPKINAALQAAWLGKNEGTTLTGKRVPVTNEMRYIANVIQEAGGRVLGYRHDPTLDFGGNAYDNFWKSWKRGDLRNQLEALKGAVTQPFHQADTVAGLARATKEAGLGASREIFRQFGQTMRSLGAPMFEHYIPAMKNGVNAEAISDWIANNSAASHEQIVAQARKIIQSTDNRFGEMINDNIFWSRTQKDIAQGLLRAYSWFLGTVGEIGGGATKLATTAASEPKQLRNVIANDPRAAYVLGLFATNMTLAAVYQYMKTGKGPEEPRDLILGKTGGKLRSGSPERAIFPGYMKDVLGWAVHPTQEAMGKFAVLPTTIMETLRNKDWRDDPIANENAPATTQLKQYLGHAIQSIEPIYLQQVGTKQKAGSNVSLPERLANIRPTSVLEEKNPAKEKAIERAWKIKQTHDKQR